jgi:hypothetical protein
LHAHKKRDVFRKNHPGGAIGQKTKQPDVVEGLDRSAKRPKGLPSPA